MAFHVLAGDGDVIAHPIVRHITVHDVTTALREGFGDFMDRPSHYLFLGLIYPIVGIILGFWTSGANALPLLYPLATGFALLGPLFGIGLYEISRREEKGQDTSWVHAFEVLRSPAIPSIIGVGIGLFALFYAWLATAETLYQSFLGLAAPASLGEFAYELFNTPEGQTLILWGNAIGLLFALVTLFTTVIAFPLLLDRDVGAAVAVTTSVRAVATNLGPMLLWGLIVALLLVVGSIPLFIGLAVVIPVLGHATWRLYRKVIA
jgi:uncharacterized membrane protein